MFIKQVMKKWKNCSFRIYEARYQHQSGTYLLLLGNRKLQSFEVSREWLLLINFRRIISLQ